MSLLDKLLGNNAAPEPDPPETYPIVGYRCWQLRESEEGVPALYSMTKDFLWLPYEPTTGDLTQDGGGVYAFKSELGAMNYWSHNSIAGEVNLWGGVLEHDEGYRAEFAYPKEFWVHKEFDATMILRLEETYGVPVVIKEDLPAIQPPPPLLPMKFTSGIQMGLMEIVRDVIYDRAPLGETYQRLFCHPVGMIVIPKNRPSLLKTWEWTNMVMAGCLPAPNRFVIKSIRCVFLEPDGRPVPVTDPIYWQASLTLRVFMKQYWRSPVAYVADPMIMLAATDWSKITADERMNLIQCLSSPLTSSQTPIPGTSATCAVDGVAIEQQMPFDVEISGADNWPDRDVLVALEGVSERAVI